MGEFGKTALVTGASRGIGHGIALVLAKEGYDLSISYSTKKDEAYQLARVIERDYKRKCYVFQASLDEEEAPGKLVYEAAEAMGWIDVFVNNAGVTIFDELVTMKLESLNKLINLDFKGYILGMQAAARHMIENDIKGSIINITSSRGERAYAGDAVYGGVKAAVNRATQSIALELSPYGIRVNCIAPGAIQVREANKFYEGVKKIIPLKRPGQPEDIGNAVAWLASDKASYVTGITLRVDGGLILPGTPEYRPQGAEDHGWGYVKGYPGKSLKEDNK